MSKRSRIIDPDILNLEGGLFDSLPPPPRAPMGTGPGREIDTELLCLGGELFDSTPPPAPAFFEEEDRSTLSPTVDDDGARVLEDPPPSRGFARSIVIAAVAGGSMALAISLVPRHSAILFGGAMSDAAPVAAAAGGASNAMTLDEVIIEGSKPKVGVPSKKANDTKVGLAQPNALEYAAPKAGESRAIKAPPISTADFPPAPVAAQGVDIDMRAATSAIDVAARRSSACLPEDDARTHMAVSVTFAPSGRVTMARVTGGAFLGTPVASCVAAGLRAAIVPPFDGRPITLSTVVRVR